MYKNQFTILKQLKIIENIERSVVHNSIDLLIYIQIIFSIYSVILHIYLYLKNRYFSCDFSPQVIINTKIRILHLRNSNMI